LPAVCKNQIKISHFCNWQNSSEDIEKAKAIAMQVLKANDRVLDEPAPSVNVIKVGDGMVTLAIRPYADQAHYWDVFFGVQEQIKNAFDANHIAGPTPTRIVINKS
jgi:small conductance mechanosensitive channel